MGTTTTTSFNNTPQATDDLFTAIVTGLTEDSLNSVTLNVMANDLGGTAKSLYSLDDSVENEGSATSADLLTKDAAGYVNYSLNGAGIWITADGKVQYDASTLSAAFKTQLQALNAGETLEDSFTYAIRLSNGTLSWATVTVRIAGVSDAPTTSAVSMQAIAEDSGARVITQADLLANAGDVDSTTLTASDLAIASGDGTLVDNGDGTWTYTPALDDDTQVSFSYTISDGALNVAGSLTLDITAVNDAPELTGTQATLVAGTEDTPYMVSVADLLAGFSDVDGDALSVSGLGASNGSVLDNGDGTYTITPTADYNGPVTLSYEVVDGNGGTKAASQSYSLAAVNDAPVAMADTLAATEDTQVTYTAAQLLGNDSDVDNTNAQLSLSWVGSAVGGSVQLNADGSVTFTPDANFYGDASFSYKTSDGALESTAAAVTVQVAAVNDAPTTSAVTLEAIAEDSGARLITQAQLLANAADVDNATLAATDLAIAAGSGSLVDNLDGTWTYTPAPDDDSSVSFSYTVSDGALSAAGSATLDITPVNDAPTTSAVTLEAIAEDSGERLITQAQLLANAADVDNATLTATDLAIAGGSGTLVNNGDGTWSYTPALNDDTQVGFSYTVSDGALSVAGSATMDITAVNDAPLAVADTVAATEDTQVTYTAAQLLGNDSDVDNTNAQLSLSWVGSAVGGSVQLSADGSVTFTPDANFYGDASFSYKTSDGALESGAAAVTVQVAAVNDAPTTSAVTLEAIAEDSGARLITQAQLLANAADVDNATLTATDLAIAAGSGSLVDNLDGTWTYTPAPDDDSSVSFSYTVSDGALSAAGSATLDITPVNDAPTTSAVTLEAIAEDSGERLITQAQLLANAQDVESATLTAATLAIAAGSGSLVDNLDGTWTYTPAPNDDSSVSFSYTVSDGLLSVAGSATLDITPVNDAPIVAAPIANQSSDEDQPWSFTVPSGIFSDVDGDSLTYNATLGNGNPLPSWLSFNSATRTLTGTPPQDFNGQLTLKVTATDSGLLTASSSFDVTINPVNDAPVLTSAATIGIVREHLINTTFNGFTSTIVGSVAAVDADGAAVMYSIVGDSSGGAFKIDAASGQVTVRDVSLLDYEGGGLSTDADGKYYTLTVRASDGSAWTEQAAKVYIADVSNTTTNSGDNYVDGNAEVNSFSLNNGNDVAFGDGANDTLNGQGNNDWLFGGGGNDTLDGANGNDMLYGGSGVDALTGGGGADTFVFGHGWNSGVDTINDFKRLEGDKILLGNDYAGLFSALSDGALSPDEFRSGAGATTATTADHRLVYDTTTGNLYYDADGEGGANAVHFATLGKVMGSIPTLLASDIVAGPPPGP